jgi:6-phosphogluconolactonase
MNGVKIFDDVSKLMNAAARDFVDQANKAIVTNGGFSVALSGGSTPRELYTLLASAKYAERIDWSRVHVFWGDERCVLPDHIESNYRMARETLLEHVPLPSGNIHRIHGEMDPEAAAAEYQRELCAFFDGDTDDHECSPRFDLVLLGMGDDGHTASLFPETAALREASQYVIANYIDKLHSWRITLTPMAINAAANIMFLVAGTGKSSRLHQILNGPYQPGRLPAQIIQPEDGNLSWFVDAAALYGNERERNQ